MTPSRRELPRFDLTERLVHWSTAALLLSLLVTGTILYVPAFSVAVGHRATVEQVHVVTGLGLLGPIALGLAGPWRRRLLGDVRTLDRWTSADWAWFRGRRRSKALGLETGKFNGGQKAEAALLGGGMVIMVLTGIVMRWSPLFPASWATGATFLHDAAYVAIALAVAGHIVVALSRPDQMVAMLTGSIPLAWAREHAPAWLRELGEDPTASSGPPGIEQPAATARARPRSETRARRDAAARSGS